MSIKVDKSWKCEFVREGEEDIRDIIKRQFVNWINEQYPYPVIALKDDIIKEHFKEEYLNKKINSNSKLN
ncbi:hypothetical protein [Bacillus sp. SA1-12]|uniref:hypothetical protein n=1 Tax=Bacillus sp. SA1-12 TaxID=1455638 RepID=UPI0012E0B550|nr:hypothetical protein [Bacillus sp. SA1-12]